MNTSAAKKNVITRASLLKTQKTGDFMKLSIIVPVYNLENYISVTLDSLLSIRFSDSYEILVINDGSKDRSEEIIRSYQQKHSQIKLYTIENQGVSNARNFGISKAKGDYLTFVDGDDTVNPDFFEKAIREMDMGNYDFVQGNFVIVDQGRSNYTPQYVYRDIEIYDYREMLFLFFDPKRKKIHNAVWGKVYKADSVRGLSFDCSLTVAEDQKFVFDVLCKAKKIKLLKDLGIHYIQRSSSVMHSFSASKEYGKISVLEYFIARVPFQEIKSLIQWQQYATLFGLYSNFTKLREPKADEIWSKMMAEYSKEWIPFMSTKEKIIIGMLKHARFVLDLYLRR